jgi:hypothetical protein
MEVAAVVVWQEQQLGCQMVSVIVAATGRRHNKSHSSRCKCRNYINTEVYKYWLKFPVVKLTGRLKTAS